MKPEVRVRVYVATTEGPVQVERIVEEPGILQSTARLGTSTRPALFGSGYDDFVKRGSGVIARDIAPGPFRMNLSGPIHDGESWQLGVYLAHALAAQGRLAGPGEAADAVAWLTGRVDFDRLVHGVDEVGAKLRASAGLFAELRATATPLFVFLPADNVGAGDAEAMDLRLVAAASAEAVCAHFGLAAGPAAGLASGPAHPPPRSRRALWLALGAAVVAVTASALLWRDLAGALPPAVADQAAAAVASPAVRVLERRAPPDAGCAAVHMGSAAAVLVAPPAVAENAVAPARGLCGLRFVVSVPPPPRRVRLAASATRGRLIELTPLPPELSGAAPFSGERSSDVDLPYGTAAVAVRITLSDGETGRIVDSLTYRAE